jgi:hypothetical protein
MKFDAPRLAPAHQALLSALAAEGQDVDAFRRLLWLTNAHPLLVAHWQVFKHIQTFLDSPASQKLDWASGWTSDIPAWRSACQYIVEERHNLALIPELEEFDRKPKRAADHPHLSFGVSRHGVVAALWNDHQLAIPNSQHDEPLPAVARYLDLQAHLFLAYAESRHRHSTQEFYEAYNEDREAPIAPMATAAVGLAVREFSLGSYGALLAQLPATSSTPSFAEAIADQSYRLEGLDEAVEVDAIRYLDAIQRYFRRFLRVLLGWVPPQEKRHRTGGGHGGGRRHPGFVPVEGVRGVFFGVRQPTPDDEDIPYTKSTPVFVEDSDADDDDLHDVEASGLAPGETKELALRLYTPSELSSKVSSVRYQQLAIEMQGQFLWYSYAHLTPTELRRHHQLLEAIIQGNFANSTQPAGAPSRRTLLALMSRVMLLFGQPLEQARNLRYCWVTRLEEAAELVPEHLTLVLIAPEDGAWNEATVGGFLLPAIGPYYKTKLDEALDDVNRALADGVLLPDVFALGAQLLEFLHKSRRPNNHVFGLDPKSAKKEMKTLMEEVGEERLTADKVARVMPDLIHLQTGDPSLAWVATADQSSANESRLFYTRHSVSRIRHAYVRAARRLARDMGIQTAPIGNITVVGSEETRSVGARFVLRLDDLRGLIEILKAQLYEHRRIPLSLAGILRYHDAFLLYTWMFQSLHTTIRAVKRPNELYQRWMQSADTRRLTANLSDKQGRYRDKERLVGLAPALVQQYANYELHIDHVIRRLGIRDTWKKAEQEDLPLLVIGENLKLSAFRPKWAEEQLAARFAPLPANFHRAFLRTELLERGCPAEVVDAFLGHANAGESPFGRFSTFDFGLHLPTIESYLEPIHAAIGLVPVASRLVPHTTRKAS